MSAASRPTRAWSLLAGALTAIALALVPAAATGQEARTYPIPSGKVIADADSAGPVTTTVSFDVAEEFVVGSAALRLSMAHSFILDLVVILISPSRNEMIVFDTLGFGGGLSNLNKWLADVEFKDDALSVPGRVGPWSGDLIPPSGAFVAFNGEPAKGAWQLEIIDFALGDAGYVYAAGDDSNALPSNAERFGIALGTALHLVPAGEVVDPWPQRVDDWRALQFGTRENTGEAADFADPDGDQIWNLMEYALGFDPFEPKANSGLLDVSIRQQSPGEWIFVSQLVSNRPTPADMVITLQFSDNGATWLNAAISRGGGRWTRLLAGGFTVTESTSGDGKKIAEFSVPARSSPGGRLVRLEFQF